MSTNIQQLVPTGDLFEVKYKFDGRTICMLGRAGSLQMVKEWVRKRKIQDCALTIRQPQDIKCYPCAHCGGDLACVLIETVGPMFFFCRSCVVVYRTVDIYWVGSFERNIEGLFPVISGEAGTHEVKKLRARTFRSTCVSCGKRQGHNLSLRFAGVPCRRCGTLYFANYSDFSRLDEQAAAWESSRIHERLEQARFDELERLEKERKQKEVEENKRRRLREAEETEKFNQEIERRRREAARAKLEAEAKRAKKKQAFFGELGIGPVPNELEVKATFACLPPVCCHAAVLVAETLLTGRLKHDYEVDAFAEFIRDALTIEKLRVSGEDFPDDEIQKYLAVVLPRYGLQIAAAAMSLAIWQQHAKIESDRSKQAVKGAVRAALFAGLAAAGISIAGG